MFKKLGYADKILFSLNLGSSIVLLISFLSQYLDPSQFWFISILGLAFPAFFLIELAFCFYWTLKLKTQAFLSLIILLMVSAAIPRHFQLRESEERLGTKILSFNAQVFDHYRWKKDPSKRRAIYSFLKEESASIVCFQEYFESRREFYKDFNDSLAAAVGQNHQSHKEYSVDYYGNLFGLATFSEFPIINSGKIALEQYGANICIYTDLLFQEDTVRVYNMHLASLHLNNESYELFENVENGLESKNIKAVSNLLRRMKKGYQRRKLQVVPIAEHIKNSPYPVILCGDFNDGPNSYSYHLLSEGLKDSFVETGFGFGNTYNGKLPSLRIDYILHAAKFNTISHRVIKKDLSDHFPIVAQIEPSDTEL